MKKNFDDLSKYESAMLVHYSVMAQFNYLFVGPIEQEQEYLVCHKKLPGSLRTSRLRKKRKTIVESWYRNR